MSWGWIIAAALFGAFLAARAERHRTAALIAQFDAYLDRAKVQEIRRLLQERRWYGGVLHGVEIDVTPVSSGGWWVEWSTAAEVPEVQADGLVPDDQLDGELLRWVRGPRVTR